MSRRGVACAAAALTLLGGCAGQQAGPEPVRAARARAALPPVLSISVSPADYVSRASSASLLLVRASQLVSEREGASALGQQARRVVADHQGIAAQLSFAGRRLNLLPSAMLADGDQVRFDRLAASADVAAEYRRMLGEVLPGLAVFHDQYRRLGTSATLRPVAAMAAPVVRREVDGFGR
jgi:predicted outer membrane protein